MVDITAFKQYIISFKSPFMNFFQDRNFTAALQLVVWLLVQFMSCFSGQLLENAVSTTVGAICEIYRHFLFSESLFQSNCLWHRMVWYASICQEYLQDLASPESQDYALQDSTLNHNEYGIFLQGFIITNKRIFQS